MRYFLVIISITLVSCGFLDKTQKSTTDYTYEVIEDQRLIEGVYWYFEKVASDQDKIYILDCGPEIIYFVVGKASSEKFEFIDETVSGYIVDKDGSGYEIVSGKIKVESLENNARTISCSIKGQLMSEHKMSEDATKEYLIEFENQSFRLKTN